MAKKLPVTELCIKAGITYNCYIQRIKRGWTHEAALSSEKKNKPMLNFDDLRLVYAMLDERDRHLKEARKLTYQKIAKKIGACQSTIVKIHRGELYVRKSPIFNRRQSC